MTSLIPIALAPILLLLASNVFMTFAWYGQLKFPGAVLWQVVLVSWGIAFLSIAWPCRPTASATKSIPLPSSRRCRKSLRFWYLLFFQSPIWAKA